MEWLVPGERIQLRSRETGHYLRIHLNGHVDALGAHGELAHFIVLGVPGHPGEWIFQSCANPHHHLAINAEHNLVGTGGVGPFAKFRLIHHGNRTVTLQSVHFHDKGLVVAVRHNGEPENNHHMHGSHARFDIEPAGYVGPWYA